MKLLFDQNISFRIINRIVLEFPESKHLSNVGLAGADLTSRFLFNVSTIHKRRKQTHPFRIWGGGA
jgi:hypothetical protein